MNIEGLMPSKAFDQVLERGPGREAGKRKEGLEWKE